MLLDFEVASHCESPHNGLNVSLPVPEASLGLYSEIIEQNHTKVNKKLFHEPVSIMSSTADWVQLPEHYHNLTQTTLILRLAGSSICLTVATTNLRSTSYLTVVIVAYNQHHLV